MQYYLLTIKSHCEAPDFEDEVMAPSLSAAVKMFLERNRKYLPGFSLKDLTPHILTFED